MGYTSKDKKILHSFIKKLKDIVNKADMEQTRRIITVDDDEDDYDEHDPMFYTMGALSDDIKKIITKLNDDISNG